ncbi:MAG TPA: DUF4139 domain-containing protein, partial [Rhodanobacteraceae bacterium]
MPSRTLLALALAVAITTPAMAASDPQTDLTIYRSDNSALYAANQSGVVDAGHAVVHEDRTLQLTSGTHDVVLDNLPDFLDPEAVHLNLAGSHAQVLSQRLLLPHGQSGTLNGQIGKSVIVIGANGQALVKGMLTQVNPDGSLVIGGDVFGPTLVRNYAAVKLSSGEVGGGARLQLRIDADNSGNTKATLTYPTAGIGWRAAYTGILEPGHSCRLRLSAQASIANRSGRDWNNANVKLVAGSPHFAKSGGPRPVMMMAKAAPASAAPMPRQNTLDDYRTYTLPGAVNLPSGSVTLTPLYKTRTISCQRTWLFENGNTWQPTQPVTTDNDAGTRHGPVASTLDFTAFDSFPAGNLRVLTTDNDGNAEFLGAGTVADTPKGQPVQLTLGNAFDLTGTRERTSFDVNKAARQMTEGFTITLTNAGNSARTVTVREHPWRWRQWKL